MKREEAKTLYGENWDLEYTTMEDLYKRIKALAENGAYSLCVYIDSRNQYDEVYGELSQNGYDVEHYNGGNNNILEVSWG
jgi:superfamily II DNA helicase RecQ